MDMVEAGKGLLAAAKTAADAQKAVTNATSAAKDASSKMAASAKSTAAALVAQVEIDNTVHLCLGCEGPSAGVLLRVVPDYPSFCLSQAELLLGGRQPVWLHPSFREEVLGQSLVHEAQPSAADLTAILGSMTLVVAQLQSLRGAPPGGASPALAAAAAAVHESFRQSLVACQHMVPRVKPTTEPQPTQALLGAVVTRAKALTAGGALVVPAGWRGGGATVVVLHCDGQDAYTLAVCTASGAGLHHHPMRADEGTAAIEHNSPLLLRGVRAAQALEGSFWCVLLQALLDPEVGATPGRFYEQLLPYLNKIPLRANLPSEAGPGSSWLAPNGDGDRCGHQAVTMAAVVALQLCMGGAGGGGGGGAGGGDGQ